jgi:hypothetical protein
MSNQYIYGIGVTQLSLGATPLAITPGANERGFYVKAGSSAAIVNAATGVTTATGYLLSSDMEFLNPVTFYLAAPGAETLEMLIYKSADS